MSRSGTLDVITFDWKLTLREIKKLIWCMCTYICAEGTPAMEHMWELKLFYFMCMGICLSICM